MPGTIKPDYCVNKPETVEIPQIRIERRIDGLYVTTGVLLFRVIGLSTDNLHRLKVTLRVSFADKENNSFSDIIDLYRSEERSGYADRAFSETGIKSSVIITEIKRLIEVIEKERVRLLENREPDVALELSDQEKKEAIDFLSQKDLLTRIKEDFQKMGIVGEEGNCLLLYLALTSRLHSIPLSALITSRDSAGKSHIRDIVSGLMPTESVKQYTYITSKALLYEAPFLNNKALIIEEIEGIRESLPYLRSIISDQRISALTTISEARIGQRSTQSISNRVGVSVIVSTCHVNSFDSDFRRLFLQITLDETPEQTKRIIEEQLRNESTFNKTLQNERERIKRIHQNAQKLLRSLPVLFPERIDIDYPSACIENRRDMVLFISLVKTIALLKQYRREIKDGAVIVEREDIEEAIQLSKHSFAVASDELTPQARNILSLAKTFVKQKHELIHKGDPEISFSEISFTRRDIRELYKCSESYMRPFFNELQKKEYIGKVTGGQGLQYSYVLLDQNEKFAELRSHFALQAS